MFDWNELRTFLAVARGGSALAAAKALAINQTTAARRIEALEQAVGLKRVERGQAGSRLTEAGQALIIEAEAVERAAEGIAHQARSAPARNERDLAGDHQRGHGQRLPGPGPGGLPPALSGHQGRDGGQRRVPGPGKGEADVAIRGSGALTLADSDLISQAERHQLGPVLQPRLRHPARLPHHAQEIDEHLLIGGEGTLANLPALKWMAGKAPRGRCIPGQAP